MRRSIIVLALTLASGALAKSPKQASKSADSASICDRLRPEQTVTQESRQAADAVLSARVAGVKVDASGATETADTREMQVLAQDDLARGWFNYQTCVLKEAGLIDEATAQDLVRMVMGLPAAPATPSPSVAAERPDEPAKPSTTTSAGQAPPSSSVFYEDFKESEEGTLPAGWSADSGIGVVRRPDGACLGQMNKEKHTISTPPLALPRDFAIDLDVFWGRNGYMNQRFSVRVGATTARVGGGYDSDEVALTNAQTLRGPAGPFEERRAKFTLEKRGSVFKVYGDGGQLIMSRVDTFDATRAAELPVAFEVYSANFCLYRMTVRDLSQADPQQ